MDTTNTRVFHGPRVVALSAAPVSARTMELRLRRVGVRFTEDVDLLCVAAAAETSVQAEFLLECRTAEDYGYTDPQIRPTLETLYGLAQGEGLHLATPKVACALAMRRTHPIHAGVGCIVAMVPIVGPKARLYVPQLQGISGQDGFVRTLIRMMMGTPTLEYNIRQPFMFLRSI